MSVPEEVLLRARKVGPRPGERMSRCLGLWALSGCLMLLLLLSGTALAGCLLLSARTAELQGRVSALEEQGCRGSVPGEGAPAAWAGGLGTVQGSGQEEALLALLQPGLDRLLQEKLREGLAKMRTVREAPECNCPPGPPGKRGKVGRRGDPGARPRRVTNSVNVCLASRLGTAKHTCAVGSLQASNTVAGLERACTGSRSACKSPGRALPATTNTALSSIRTGRRAGWVPVSAAWSDDKGKRRETPSTTTTTPTDYKIAQRVCLHKPGEGLTIIYKESFKCTTTENTTPFIEHLHIKLQISENFTLN
ncbi:uncharacterized protein [Pleurodeles waltl]|uniref:uncharacterized protein n=1 Tax=Pleurodeles waltl TaxID=8319 RepID=UPI0037098E78